jgi:hypothetical protein
VLLRASSSHCNKKFDATASPRGMATCCSPRVSSNLRLCHVVSRRVTPCHAVSRQVTPCHAMSHRATQCDEFHAGLRAATTFHVSTWTTVRPPLLIEDTCVVTRVNARQRAATCRPAAARGATACRASLHGLGRRHAISRVTTYYDTVPRVAMCCCL